MRRPCGERAKRVIVFMSDMRPGIPRIAVEACLMRAMPTGAEVIVAQLEEAGVEVCFGLPGVHNLALWEALRESPIRLVGVRHEQAAAYAADGYARATGRLGVALTTTGPGAANTLGAVGEAWASRSPILVIATDIPTTLRRPGVYRGVLHETSGPGGHVPAGDARRARRRRRAASSARCRRRSLGAARRARRTSRCRPTCSLRRGRDRRGERTAARAGRGPSAATRTR